MQPAFTASDHQLLLAGGGHGHALLLKRWAMRPMDRPRAAIALVSRQGATLYSGMVPGLVGGVYARPDCLIDLRDLCRRAGVCFIQAEIHGIDLQRRLLRLQGRPPLAWDSLSLNVGAVSNPTAFAGAELAIPVKPLEPFLTWWQQQLEQQRGQASERAAPFRLAILGAGAGGLELAMAMQQRWHRDAMPSPLMLSLIGSQGHPSPGNAGMAGATLRQLAGQGIHWLGAARVQRLRQTPQGLAVEWQSTAAGAATTPRQPQQLLVDAAIHCAGPVAPAWLAQAGLACDGIGRVLTHTNLTCLSAAAVFASGDCGVIATSPRPPSGVWAVRAAGILADNLLRHCGNRPLRHWQPQRQALQLLGTGLGTALGWRGRHFLGQGRWHWHLKQWIDRRFIAGLREQPSMAADAAQMPCRGCAAKLSAKVLSLALRAADQGSDPEDAHPVGLSAAGPLLQSVDGFPALVEDPWLNARLTSLHACADLWACGAQVDSAQAIVALPQGPATLQVTLLAQTLAGIKAGLAQAGGTLIGGHSMEGSELSVCLSVNGSSRARTLWGKGELQSGDALVLSRPIGSGVLFAAAMRGLAQPEHVDAALSLMGTSQHSLVDHFAGHDCHACTDISGFGLLGHLSEMLEASRRRDPGLHIQLHPRAIPAMAGALQLLEQGLHSSLAPANRRLLARYPGLQAMVPVLQELLVDPQTCGPLLAAVPMAQVGSLLGALQGGGFADAAMIGRCTWQAEAREGPDPWL